uniref:Uncharacterized protein n=1 Tax=Anguilla anguilla TaxID=7936 RepID=A0A0E9PXC1_ANGAN
MFVIFFCKRSYESNRDHMHPVRD